MEISRNDIWKSSKGCNYNVTNHRESFVIIWINLKVGFCDFEKGVKEIFQRKKKCLNVVVGALRHKPIKFL